jgi:hypothetical protein
MADAETHGGMGGIDLVRLDLSRGRESRHAGKQSQEKQWAKCIHGFEEFDDGAYIGIRRCSPELSQPSRAFSWNNLRSRDRRRGVS